MYSRKTKQTKESRLSRIFQRFTGFAFPPCHKPSPSGLDSTNYHKIMLQMDVNTPAGPQEKPVQFIRALTLPNSAKAGFSARQRRCNSFFSDSTDSTTSVLQSGKDKSTMAQRFILSTMPFEILECICSFLSQQDLLKVILVCSKFKDVATRYLCMEPEFASTYRFAQVILPFLPQPLEFLSLGVAI
jgi:hypothetical protein